MSTTNERAKSVIDTDAYNLLSCFYDGLDQAAYNLAEQIARERQTDRIVVGEPVEIELQDVREAGCRLVASLRKLLADEMIPVQMRQAVEGMANCFENSSARLGAKDVTE